MNLSDQLECVRYMLEEGRQSRRFASAIGRRSGVQQWDLEINDLHSEESELMERIQEQELC